METKSPWNEYGVAKIQELENELTRLTTIVNEQQTTINKMAEILGKFTKIFSNLAGAVEGDDRK
jgi:hypothetical protein